MKGQQPLIGKLSKLESTLPVCHCKLVQLIQPGEPQTKAKAGGTNRSYHLESSSRTKSTDSTHRRSIVC